MRRVVPESMPIPSRLWPLALAMGIGVACTLACGQPSDPDSGQDGSTQLDAGDGDAADANEADQVQTVPDSKAGWPPPKDPCAGGHTFIDFPCAADEVCTSETSYDHYKSIGCKEAGYNPQCCSGITCKSLGNDKCPAGKLCRVEAANYVLSACVTPNCATDLDCKGGTYCLRPRSQCGATDTVGVCTGAFPPNYPSAKYDSGALCGCDGVTYYSFAAVLKAKVSVEHAGSCCDPSKMPIEKNNPAGYTQLEICDLPYFQKLSIGCVNPKEPPSCTGSSSCFLDLPADSTLSDAQWDELCWAASAGTKAYGHPVKP